MDAPERFLAWLADERRRLIREIELLSSGLARRMESSGGRMLDSTGDALKDVRRRKSELDALLQAKDGDVG